MYKLIDKIPENISEDKIEKKELKYAEYHHKCRTIVTKTGVYADRTEMEELDSLLLSFGYFPAWVRNRNSDVRSFCDFYITDSFGRIPKKWIDGKKEILIYEDSADKYFHLIVGEYKEKL